MTDLSKRTLLVIEDNDINREILCAILDPYYNTIEATNGREGLSVLDEYASEISLILLDIQMPVMNGYEFMDEVRKNSEYSRIPIIVTTSSATATDEIMCLENGASDFVSKPYNSDVVLRRIGSMIRLSEATSVLDRVEYDRLTGLYGRSFFLVNMEKLLERSDDVEYDVMGIDLISFKMVKDRYGEDAANDLLVAIADAMREIFPQSAVLGQLRVERYCAMTPHMSREFYDEAAHRIREAVAKKHLSGAMVHLGVYRSVDRNESATNICAEVFLAVESVRHQYGRQIAEYNDEMRKKLFEQQTILSLMENALAEGQFSVYYQPKFDLAKNEIGGAEALIRWISPELGFMNPGVFIPLFEQSGFITSLDYYVVDQVCRDICRWRDEGMNIVPISLNISRADFAAPDLVDTIKATLDKYDVPYDLVHIEVTESAYTENMEVFLDSVCRLREIGFKIELDDFGSGYSSMTVLNDLEMDVLKLDMSLVRNLDSHKQGMILTHVLSIGHSLGMDIVAEGVETEHQAKKLRDMGCTYAQGYYYAKPLTRDDFEKYLLK